MRTLILGCFSLFVILAAAQPSQAQVAQPGLPTAPLTVLQQTLLAHVSGQPVSDITAVGTITVGSGSPQAVTISVKGMNQMRMDYPTTKQSVVYSGQQGWTTNANGKTLSLEPQATGHRPTIFPFLDLITEVANTKSQIVDGGAQTLNGRSVRRVSLTLPDPTPNIRLFKKPLDQALDVYIDAQTFLVTRSTRYRTPDKNINMKVPSVLDFSDYRIVSGTQVPFKIVNTVGNAQMGITVSTLVLQTVTINTGLADSLFAPH